MSVVRGWKRWDPEGAGGGAEWWNVPTSGPPPDWWPTGESWPPRSRHDSAAWAGFRRRAVRIAAATVLALLALPLAVGVLLAVTIGGWTSVLVALVSWVGLLVALVVASRFAVRSFRPARDLINATDRLADGDHAARVTAGLRSPFGPVVRSFNRMAARLEEAEHQRRRLLADIGHELRTPLTVVRGDLEAMADGVRPMDGDQLRVLLDDVAVMERLLDDLQTLSIAEAGQLTLDREPTDLGLLAGDVVDRLRAEAEAGGVVLEMSSDGSPVERDVDPVRIREVLSNLVVNALRACSDGDGVTVTVRPTPTGGAAVQVIDTGQGIPPEELDRVFDRFHKGAGSRGSGLGLTISRDLVEAHGGTITLASEPGTGTTVTVTL